ncbi:MAG: hypothetical protein FJZ57_01180 [Chlamydiae bacterium]|nr:hypothetical protein [Chlamydiota bacterium]
MQNKLRLYNPDYARSLQEWENRADKLTQINPIKQLNILPQMEDMTKDTARFLKIKSLWYLAVHDKKQVFLRYFFKKPIRHISRLLFSYVKNKCYTRDGDFFFYGITNENDLLEKLNKKNHLLVLGFSYCHKPFECPAKRFSSECIHDANHPVCGQCFIGKTMNHLPNKNIIPVFIPTIHFIGEKIFEIKEANPQSTVYFLITACGMSLEMFGDYAFMSGIKGIGVRLGGRICNTMRAFKLSEEGIKPGLTVVTKETQRRILDFIELLHSHNDTTCGKA